MNTDQITALIITFNEEDNIARTLDSIHWAGHILVIDSGSTDRTLKICSGYSAITVLHNPFKSFADQCNFGLAQILTPWVLSLDADYEVSGDFGDEIQRLAPAENEVGFRARFVYRIFGKALRGTLYPPRVVLFRKAEARYLEDGHAHKVALVGKVSSLKSPIFHDDRKPLDRWFASQQRYAQLEADHLEMVRLEVLSRVDTIRKKGWSAPILVLLYTLFIKGCILDGPYGWYYCLQRTIAECILALELRDRRLRRAPPG
jgi:glycosyltransferase involved in cell wall biosynthesis